jgi:hypothetical protein
MSPRGQRLALLALAAVAVILRATPVILTGGAESARDPSQDSVAYVTLAQGLRDGCGFARLIDGRCSRAEIDRTPGYPAFLALMPNLRMALAVQALLWGAIAFAAGSFVYEDWGATAGLLTSGLIAFDVPSIVFSAEIMSETVFTACFALAVIIAFHALKRGHGGRPSLWLLMFASFLLAYAVLTRPIGEFGLVAPAVLVLGVAGGPFVRRLGFQALLISVPLITIVVWSVRNYKVAGIATTSSVTGMNLFFYRAGGALTFASGRHWLDAVNRMEREPLDRLTPAALAIIAQHPVAFTKMTAWSLFFVSFAPVRTPLAHLLGRQRTFEPEDPGSIRLRSALSFLRASPGAALRSVYKHEFFSSPMMLGLTIFQILSAMILWVGVLASLSLASRRTHKGALILICAAAGFVLLLLASGPEGTARLRVPALPFLAILAGVGWAKLGKRLQMSFPARGPQPGLAKSSSANCSWH